MERTLTLANGIVITIAEGLTVPHRESEETIDERHRDCRPDFQNPDDSTVVEVAHYENLWIDLGGEGGGA